MHTPSAGYKLIVKDPEARIQEPEVGARFIKPVKNVMARSVTSLPLRKQGKQSQLSNKNKTYYTT